MIQKLDDNTKDWLKKIVQASSEKDNYFDRDKAVASIIDSLTDNFGTVERILVESVIKILSPNYYKPDFDKVMIQFCKENISVNWVYAYTYGAECHVIYCDKIPDDDKEHLYDCLWKKQDEYYGKNVVIWDINTEFDENDSWIKILYDNRNR